MSEVECEEILATLTGERSVALADYDISEPTSPRIAPLTLFASTFTHRDALAAVARAFDASASEVARLTTQLLRRDGVLWMIGGENNEQPDVSGRGRERRAATIGDRRYTTVEMLTVEGTIVNSAVRRVGRSAGQVNRRTIDEVLPPTGISMASRRMGYASSSGQERFGRGHRPGGDGEVDHARGGPGRMGNRRLPGHGDSRGQQDGGRAPGRLRASHRSPWPGCS